jgi:hypothetical protein
MLNNQRTEEPDMQRQVVELERAGPVQALGSGARTVRIHPAGDLKVSGPWMVTLIGGGLGFEGMAGLWRAP